MTKLVKFCWYGLNACSLLLIALYFYPVSTKATKIIFISLLLLVVLFLIVFAIAKKRVVGISVFVLIFLCLLKFIYNTQQPLNEIYVGRLKVYEGTKYVWGGEGRRGIDCSGLVRMAMVNALIRKGVSDFDLYKLKLASDIWWNDCTANSLKNGYRNYTAPVSNVRSLNDADSGSLKKGDLATTLDGVHVLAYIGNNEWIEADPIVMEVIKKQTPTDNPWFNMPMKIVRWTMLEY